MQLVADSVVGGEAVEYASVGNVSVGEGGEDRCGPIIACVDTSGSMYGAPEVTAKALLLALAKEAVKSGRKCYVISFSVEIETLDLSTFKGGGAMEKLIGFLNMSFWGGTDIDPAIRECLRMLKGEEYRNSDVIMISDFITPALPQEDVVVAVSPVGREAVHETVDAFCEEVEVQVGAFPHHLPTFRAPGVGV